MSLNNRHNTTLELLRYRKRLKAFSHNLIQKRFNYESQNKYLINDNKN